MPLRTTLESCIPLLLPVLFFYIIFIRIESLSPVHFQGVGNWLYLLKGRESYNLWAYFKTTTNKMNLYVLKCGVVYYILYEKCKPEL